MGRVYQYIKSIIAQKVWPEQEEFGPRVEIKDPRVIAEFQRLADDAPSAEWYQGNLDAPRWFVRIVGRGGREARGSVLRHYAFFNDEHIYLQGKQLSELLERHAE